MENKYYVYAHINRVTNKIFYIGKGSGERAFTSRGRNEYWCNIIKQYGGFNVEILESNLTNADAYKREAFYIKFLGVDNLTNKMSGNIEGGHSEYSKIKMSENRKGKEAWNKGIPRTDEVKEKLRLANKGNGKGIPKSEETKRKISDANKGVAKSEETKRKLSEAHKGKISPLRGTKHPEEMKKRISETLKGKMKGIQKSEETKLKMKEAWKLRKINKNNTI